eukprot:430894-Hanusia_phi.AAC.1
MSISPEVHHTWQRRIGSRPGDDPAHRRLPRSSPRRAQSGRGGNAVTESRRLTDRKILKYRSTLTVTVAAFCLPP